MYSHPYLEHIKSRGIILGLNRMKDALIRIGSPQKYQKGAVVAGTNGKGSTSYTLQRLLYKQGFKTALYTSPHIVEINERYKIDDMQISDDELVNYINRLRPIAERFNLTLFEFETLIAFEYFKDSQTDFSIYEVGMGGRLDATNCFDTELKIITNISDDHKEFLGDTLLDILREKAGIIKTGNTVVSGVNQSDLKDELIRICNDLRAMLYIAERDFEVENISSLNGRYSFDYRFCNTYLKNLQISSPARYQILNVAIALTGFIKLSEIYGFNIHPKTIRDSLDELNFKGRFEILSEDPLIIFDGAHNTDGVKKLVDSVKQYNRNYKKILCIFSSLKNKNPAEKLQILREITDSFILVPNQHPLSCSASDYRLVAKDIALQHFEITDIRSAISKVDCGFRDHLILITGSLYIYRDIYTLLKRQNR